ncbi:zinc finger protein 705A-like isoform X3 [Choloepus didactylus]|uniref:zinc finger protein 705A-like isoform X3 n=1 Tax=Choloepus didactylus TaxID=27675 RepID=UPI0018A0E71A|nr:zinc finger protein 705A-like isoform X3 [Choloepus didactylus]XP_037674649.1 zinc finger protein 705A-like isoform X3 [Choloepus didactylus]
MAAGSSQAQETPESVTFNDVAINCTKEEWAMLDTNQRKMFRDVMLENISHLVFMGLHIRSAFTVRPRRTVERRIKVSPSTESRQGK